MGFASEADFIGRKNLEVLDEAGYIEGPAGIGRSVTERMKTELNLEHFTEEWKERHPTKEMLLDHSHGLRGLFMAFLNLTRALAG